MSCQKCLWPTINFSTLPSQLQYALQMNYGWRMKIQFASRVCMHETCTTDTCLWWTAERPTIHEVILLNKTLTMFFSLLFCHIQLNRIEFLLSYFFLLLFMFVLRFAFMFYDIIRPFRQRPSTLIHLQFTFPLHILIFFLFYAVTHQHCCFCEVKTHRMLEEEIEKNIHFSKILLLSCCPLFILG